MYHCKHKFRLKHLIVRLKKEESLNTLPNFFTYYIKTYEFLTQGRIRILILFITWVVFNPFWFSGTPTILIDFTISEDLNTHNTHTHKDDLVMFFSYFLRIPQNSHSRLSCILSLRM